MGHLVFCKESMAPLSCFHGSQCGNHCCRAKQVAAQGIKAMLPSLWHFRLYSVLYSVETWGLETCLLFFPNHSNCSQGAEWQAPAALAQPWEQWRAAACVEQRPLSALQGHGPFVLELADTAQRMAAGCVPGFSWVLHTGGLAAK